MVNIKKKYLTSLEDSTVNQVNDIEQRLVAKQTNKDNPSEQRDKVDHIMRGIFEESDQE